MADPWPNDNAVLKALGFSDRKRDKTTMQPETDAVYIARLVALCRDRALTIASYDRTANSEPEAHRRILHADAVVRHRREIVAALGIRENEEVDDAG